MKQINFIHTNANLIKTRCSESEFLIEAKNKADKINWRKRFDIIKKSDNITK